MGLLVVELAALAVGLALLGALLWRRHTVAQQASPRRIWYKPRVLWRVPDGAIVGDASGRLMLVPPGGFLDVIENRRTRLPVIRVAADVIDLPAMFGQPAHEVPLHTWRVGPYRVQAGYTALLDIWYIEGMPRRIRTDGNRIDGGYNPYDGRAQY